ncbi:MAG: PA0069 family radical SAM protein [Leptospirillia bacterium]
MSRIPPEPLRGRGALSLPDNRFEKERREFVTDGNDGPSLDNRTRLIAETARTIITENDSPDVGFSRSVNPYRGCEHGCIYCFARPSHATVGLSPGLDFERTILFKKEAPRLLEGEISHKGYKAVPIALGINTDAYQPVEESLRITRGLLEVLDRASHPVTLVTKSSLIERDLDLLSSMATRRLVHVYISLPTLDEGLSRRLEPRATTPFRRLETLKRLSSVGVPTGVLVAPVIPGLTCHEPESILERAREAGALSAGYILLRLPLEVRDLFSEWLTHHFPDKAASVLSRLREYHGGKLYDARFGVRMRGEGPLAELLSRRMEIAVRRLGFPGLPELDTDLFFPPVREALSRLFPDFTP